MLEIFIHLEALVCAGLAFAALWFLNATETEERFLRSAQSASALVFTLGLGIAVYKLTHLEMESLGEWLAFVLLSNFYAGLLRIAAFLQRAWEKWRAVA